MPNATVFDCNALKLFSDAKDAKDWLLKFE